MSRELESSFAGRLSSRPQLDRLCLVAISQPTWRAESKLPATKQAICLDYRSICRRVCSKPRQASKLLSPLASRALFCVRFFAKLPTAIVVLCCALLRCARPKLRRRQAQRLWRCTCAFDCDCRRLYCTSLGKHKAQNTER